VVRPEHLCQWLIYPDSVSLSHISFPEFVFAIATRSIAQNYDVAVSDSKNTTVISRCFGVHDTPSCVAIKQNFVDKSRMALDGVRGRNE
jgi:hypothetical protein